jgi:hypothetical protein
MYIEETQVGYPKKNIFYQKHPLKKSTEVGSKSS